MGDDLPFAQGPIGVVEVLIGWGFVASRGEARRKIAEGAVKVDGEVVSDPAAVIAPSERARVSLGKKKHGYVTD